LSTHSPTHSRTCIIIHSHSLITHSLLTHTLHPLTQLLLAHSFHSLTQSLNHLITQSPTLPLTHSLNHMHSRPLNIALLLGSTRTAGPPFPAPLGCRVGLHLARELTARGHILTVVDPRLEPFELLQKPHFAYQKRDVTAAGSAPRPGSGSLPAHLVDIAEKLMQADAYVMCTPEYNHAPSPALLNILVRSV
jgi:hypothetical protein